MCVCVCVWCVCVCVCVCVRARAHAFTCVYMYMNDLLLFFYRAYRKTLKETEPFVQFVMYVVVEL